MSEVKPIRKPPDNKEPLQRVTGEAQHDRRSDYNRTADSQPHPATAAPKTCRISRTPLYGTPTVLRRRSTTRAPWVGGLLSRLKKTFAGTPGNVCISSTLRRLLTLLKILPIKGRYFLKEKTSRSFRFAPAPPCLDGSGAELAKTPCVFYLREGRKHEL